MSTLGVALFKHLTVDAINHYNTYKFVKNNVRKQINLAFLTCIIYTTDEGTAERLLLGGEARESKKFGKIATSQSPLICQF